MTTFSGEYGGVSPMILRILFVAFVVAQIFVSVPVKAATYNVSFDGLIFDVAAQIMTDGSNNVIAITGSVTGPNGASIDGLQPIDSNPSWIYDNKFLPGSPYVTEDGILFSAGLNLYNLYSILYSLDGPLYYVSTNNSFNSSLYDPGDLGKLAVAETPLPAAIWLFGTILFGGMGFLARRRRRGDAQLSNAACA